MAKWTDAQIQAHFLADFDDRFHAENAASSLYVGLDRRIDCATSCSASSAIAIRRSLRTCSWRS
jgi:hypothetical protein